VVTHPAGRRPSSPPRRPAGCASRGGASRGTGRHSPFDRPVPILPGIGRRSPQRDRFRQALAHASQVVLNRVAIARPSRPRPRSVSQPHEHFSVTRRRRTPAAEHLPSQLSKRSHQFRLRAQPVLVPGDHFVTAPVLADDEGVGPLGSGESAARRRAPDVYVEARALPMDHVRRHKLNILLRHAASSIPQRGLETR
jgi:hypothetical protein